MSKFPEFVKPILPRPATPPMPSFGHEALEAAGSMQKTGSVDIFFNHVKLLRSPASAFELLRLYPSVLPKIAHDGTTRTLIPEMIRLGLSDNQLGHIQAFESLLTVPNLVDWVATSESKSPTAIMTIKDLVHLVPTPHFPTSSTLDASITHYDYARKASFLLIYIMAHSEYLIESPFVEESREILQRMLSYLLWTQDKAFSEKFVLDQRLVDMLSDDFISSLWRTAYQSSSFDSVSRLFLNHPTLLDRVPPKQISAAVNRLLSNRMARSDLERLLQMPQIAQRYPQEDLAELLDHSLQSKFDLELISKSFKSRYGYQLVEKVYNDAVAFETGPDTMFSPYDPDAIALLRQFVNKRRRLTGMAELP